MTAPQSISPDIVDLDELLSGLTDSLKPQGELRPLCLMAAEAIAALRTHAVAGEAKTIEALRLLGDWCQTERHKLGGVDGYDYQSGEEFGIRRVELQIDKILATLRFPGAAATPRITDEMISAAAREMWNDRDARHGGSWDSRDAQEICVIQTKATARAALTAALSIGAAQAEQVPAAWREKAAQIAEGAAKEWRSLQARQPLR